MDASKVDGIFVVLFGLLLIMAQSGKTLVTESVTSTSTKSLIDHGLMSEKVSYSSFTSLSLLGVKLVYCCGNMNTEFICCL